MNGQLLFGSLIVLAAGCLQGITGFGLSLLALPMLSIVFGIREAVPMLVLLSIVTNLWVAKDHLPELRLRLIASILLPAAIGIPAGIWGLSFVQADLLRSAAGIVIILFAIGTLANFSFMKGAKVSRPYAFGFLSGVLNGSISLSGPPVIAYLAIARLPKDAFRSNISAYFFLLNVITLGAMIASGACGTREALSALALLPSLVLGTAAGVLVSRRIHEALFRRITVGLLLVMGTYTALMH